MNGNDGCKKPICPKIRSLLLSLAHEPSKYEEITPKGEHWIGDEFFPFLSRSGENSLMWDTNVRISVEGVGFWCMSIAGPDSSLGPLCEDLFSLPIDPWPSHLR